MNSNIIFLSKSIILGTIISYLSSLFIIKKNQKFTFIKRSENRSNSNNKISRFGGLAILTSFFITYFFLFNNFTNLYIDQIVLNTFLISFFVFYNWNFR